MAAASDPVTEFSHRGATVVVEEHDGRGPHVFLLAHGIGMGRLAFGDLVEHLRPHGRVVTLDLPGYGDAPEPDRTPTIERMADLVAALLRARGLAGAVLVGHSMGTQVAVEVAARHPGLASGVVLVGPTVDARARTAPRQLGRLAHDLAIESPKVLWLGTREYLRAGPHLRRKLRAMLVHRPELAYPRVGVPALVLRGETDPVCPREWCALVSALLPDARFAEIAGHGHETMIRDAAPAAAEIMRFAGGSG
ncbi:alpha/beta fold hydrolase [Microbacterium fluvii]|uniref:Alpha/beta fold hydrolase n=1 Tax=Microbacterium fluvii TaxID=415215 RepID=A0ABW2HF24_9MICO|nr:alpha/beta hydrolase [Microbacterium fluvii]MCU4673362.1 alpha/beta hydrolase [Microbacterium fluvii]